MSETGECLATFATVLDPYSTAVVGTLVLLLVWLLQDKYQILYHAGLWLEYLTSSVPTIDVPMSDAVAKDDGVKGEPCTKMVLVDPSNPKKLNCYDPSTKQFLGQAPNMSAEEATEILKKAKRAQVEWSKTTFAQRRMVLRTIQKYICEHVEDIVRVSSRESGKAKVDAVLGEVITTCEKIRTVCEWGELWLRPDYRPTGPMMVHKSAWVEYVPLGLIVAIAPWNYPFHNSVRMMLLLEGVDNRVQHCVCVVGDSFILPFLPFLHFCFLRLITSFLVSWQETPWSVRFQNMLLGVPNIMETFSKKRSRPMVIIPTWWRLSRVWPRQDKLCAAARW